jgi:Domain of unknown function (DUF4252)
MPIMKKFFLFILLLTAFRPAPGQTKTTLNLQEKYDATLTLFFYKNTLRMLNQQENKEFDELIQNIEKMKFLLVDKKQGDFGLAEYRDLVSEYQKEKFEPIVTSRVNGRNLDVYLRDAKGFKAGTVILVNDSSSLYVLDIVGTIDVSKAGSLFNAIDGSADIGSRIRQFTERESDCTYHPPTHQKIRKTLCGE